MRKILIILFILLFSSCNEEKSIDLKVNGFYYRDNKFELYQFKKDTLVIFDLHNSNLEKNKVRFYKDYFKVGREKFHYQKFHNDFLVSYNSDTSNVFKLKKINFKELSDFEFYGTDWELIDLENSFPSVSLYLRIEEDKIINFLKYHEDSTSIIHNTSLSLRKKNDLFHLYQDQVSKLLPLNIQNDTLYMLAGNDNITKLNKFKKVITDTLQSNFFGKWKMNDFESMDSKFQSPLVALKRATRKNKDDLFFWELNFSDKGIVKEYLNEENRSSFNKYKASYNSETKYLIFAKRFNQKAEHKRKDIIFKVIEIKKGSLILKDEEKNEVYKFIKVNSDNASD